MILSALSASCSSNSTFGGRWSSFMTSARRNIIRKPLASVWRAKHASILSGGGDFATSCRWAAWKACDAFSSREDQSAGARAASRFTCGINLKDGHFGSTYRGSPLTEQVRHSAQGAPSLPTPLDPPPPKTSTHILPCRMHPLSALGCR